jgi:peptide/nickel transport system ATP-binding protein
MKKLLNVKNINTQFIIDGKPLIAVDNVSFYLKPGEIIGVVGESGSGKSVTMLSILQLIAKPGRVCGGEVYLGDNPENILEYGARSEKMRDVRGGRIGIIFQEPMTSLNPVLTVGYQICENIMLHLGVSKEEAKKQTIEILNTVGIPDAKSRYDYYPQQFSGGMRQRIMIAMAISAKPRILIADEATTALDVTTQAQLLEMLRDIAVKTGISIIIVTHNLGIVARYAQRIYVMYSGSVVETGTTKEIFYDSQHPYTRGLMKAIPRLSDPRDRVLIPIDGLPPSPATRPEHCPFYERCEYRMDKCEEREIPDLTEISPGHFAACWLNAEEKKQKAAEIAAKVARESPKKEIKKETILTVDGVSKYFPIYKGIMKRKIGVVKALESVSFDIRRGETLGLVGESGCGKTTLARCIMRMYEPGSGRIVFNGTDITHIKESAMRPMRPKISMIFQDPFSSLDPRQSAESIVGESLKIHGLTKSFSEHSNRIDELLYTVGLEPAMRGRVPHEFSGGQRQRLGIARALSSNPELIICDEPISALDVSIQAQIINLLEDLQAEMGLSYLFIAHDLAVVKHISDRIMVMYLGKVVELSDCDDLYANPLHPYTKALLASVPDADPASEEKRVRVAIHGEVPSILSRPPGCPFSDRCPHTMDKCRTTDAPPMYEARNGHQVACFLYGP